jgi:hypothetical protein
MHTSPLFFDNDALANEPKPEVSYIRRREYHIYH